MHIFIYSYSFIDTHMYKNMNKINIHIPSCEQDSIKNPWAVNPNMFFFKVAALGLKAGSYENFSYVDMAIWRDFMVGVWKRHL